ncbi:MAG: inosine/guanosine kinase [Deltaproteobacteria bacterium]|nr:inosine/guanosine kinase [Deltaproteobacteria bacterium]
MKFPGKRKQRHYFPVSERGRIPFDTFPQSPRRVYVAGIDQLIVDIEARVDDTYLQLIGIKKGQSVILDEGKAVTIYNDLKNKRLITGEYAGGAVCNTLHNYSVLSDDKSVAFGTISKNISVGDNAFNYICNTNMHVDLTYLQPVDGPIGRAMCFITPDGERTFGIAKGMMNELEAEFIDADIINNAAALLITTYVLRDETSPIFKATLKAVRLAKTHHVPVVLSLGTSDLVRAKQDFLKKFIAEFVTVLAMNDDEAFALSDENDPLLCLNTLLEIADFCLLTVGERGLYLGGYVDKPHARETTELIISKSIPAYNQYEFSRPMKKADCVEKAVKIYSHINPYLGGPGAIRSTNGAGDGALAALLHDMSANVYHRICVSNSPKHGASFLTYSSISQICKYANRVSYEIISRNSPRLTSGLPEKEDGLEESYWER